MTNAERMESVVWNMGMRLDRSLSKDELSCIATTLDDNHVMYHGRDMDDSDTWTFVFMDGSNACFAVR